MHLFYALREKFREGYFFSDFKADLLAGVVVGLVALPLGMALGVASGVLPQYGIYTIVTAGFVVALLGGSRLQVTGPTAAFVVILVPIVSRFGLSGLLMAGMMAGALLILIGLLKLGRFIELMPESIIVGFTSGIALVIASLQVKDFIGLKWETPPETFFERLYAIVTGLPHFSGSELSLGLVTLSLLIVLQSNQMNIVSRGWSRRIPSPLTALTTATILAMILPHLIAGFHIDTIETRFGAGIPQSMPDFSWPWNLPGKNGEVTNWNFQSIPSLFIPAITIALLGAVESLLSAVVADGYLKTKHEPNTELIALGIGNVIAPLFSGIPATGALARTATNYRFGGRSPISAMTHSVFVLAVILLFAPYVSAIPMTSLAALLLLVAFNMSETKNFKRMLKTAPAKDIAVLLVSFFLTVVFDMVVGVTAGIIVTVMMKKFSSQ